MILGTDLTLADVLSWPFRNSPSGGTSQATGTEAAASLGEVAELMGYIYFEPLESTRVWPQGRGQTVRPRLPHPVYSGVLCLYT